MCIKGVTNNEIIVNYQLVEKTQWCTIDLPVLNMQDSEESVGVTLTMNTVVRSSCIRSVRFMMRNSNSAQLKYTLHRKSAQREQSSHYYINLNLSTKG